MNLRQRAAAIWAGAWRAVSPGGDAETTPTPDPQALQSPKAEEPTLVESLAHDPGRGDLAIALVRSLHEQGRPLDSVDGVEGWCLTPDPQTRALEPFVFVHIAKTAGSIMRLLILSLFDQSRVFPGRNRWDFDTTKGDAIAKIDPAHHSVFVGHMTWDAVLWIENALQRKAVVFTVLREPVDRYRSHVSFVKRLAEQGVKRTIFGGDERDSDNWSDEERGIFGTILIDMQAAVILGSEYPYSSYLLRPTPYLLAAGYAEIRKARALLAERLGASHVAFFEDLRRSLDLCCKKLGLPHQTIPGLRLNSSGADHSKGLGGAQLAQVEKARLLAFELDAAARERFEAEYRGAFAGIDDVPAHLNDAYRTALLAKLKPHWCVHLTADRAWPGHGWGFREENEHGQMWRQLGLERPATIIARLHGGCDFFVSLTVHSADSDALARVTASANGVALSKAGRGFIDGPFVLDWLMPASCLAETDGSVDLVFDLPAVDGEKLFFAVAAISLYPASNASP